MDLSKQYFRLDRSCIHQPGVFEYRIGLDEQEYVYGFAISYAGREIIAEWLIRVEKSGREICLFNRDKDDDGNSTAETEARFSQKEDNIRMNIYLEDFGKNISEALKRKTILNDIAQRSNEKSGVFAEIYQVFQWFVRMIIVFPASRYGGLGEIAEDRLKRKWFSLMMNYFDTGIKAVESQKEEISFDEIIRRLPDDEANEIKVDVLKTLRDEPVMFRVNDFIYSLKKDKHGDIISTKMVLNHGNGMDLFEYADESDGTKRLFHLIPLFYESEEESTVLIDEIDRSLHTNLTRRFLELFYKLTEDERKQIIATTHDSNLLDLDLVRQDEIWFVERQEDQSSALFSLHKFKERFDKQIDREYLLGRYGAVPLFGEWGKADGQ